LSDADAKVSSADQPFISTGSAAWEKVGEGVRRQILGHGSDLMMVAVEFEAGAIGPVHRHPHRQVSYVVRGEFEIEIDGTRRVLRAGDSFYVAANLEHGAKALTAGSLVDVFTPTRQDFLGTE
jgi:quercetin dioxygenase-like cupin family protein